MKIIEKVETVNIIFEKVITFWNIYKKYLQYACIHINSKKTTK